MPKAAVIILNWNGKELLSRFLPGILQYNPSWSEIIVADNASTDDSVSFLKEKFPQVRIIQNPTNAGYAGGYNTALKQIQADYYVLLNSDVEVTPNWMEPVVQLLDSDPSIAAAQPKVRSFHNREEFEYAGAAGGFIDKYGYPFCRGRIFNSYEKDTGQYNDVKEIFWATGACLFVRSDVYHQTGGLDEDFFAHMEEIDLCWRFKNRGFKVMYAPDSTVFHMGGGTLNKVNPEKTYLNFRNNLLLLFRNHAREWFVPKFFIRMLMDGVAAFKFLFDGGPAHFWAVLRAHFSFYMSMGSVRAKRRAERPFVRAFATTCVYRKSIVWDYFIRGKKKFSELDDQAF